MEVPMPTASSLPGNGFLTQFTKRTGTVRRVEETASVAPVSSTLLVKVKMAPESSEYLASGSVIVEKDVNGSAPSVLAVSSRCVGMSSSADTKVATKYG